MIEVSASSEHFLGMPVQRFLAEYWQKKPLLIRQAFPGFVAPLTPEDLAGLACEQGPLSRLVTYERAQDRWHLRTGPFSEDEFPELGNRDWTLLVQDMDKWDADVAELLAPFSFLPRWRIDDVMISFAVEGGSVGPHIDQYDVFLVQAMGHRQWQIEDFARPDAAFRADSELKLLQHFSPNQAWDLAPGDVLYLPPGFGHHGVALDSCMTFSVGMRAPSCAEMLVDFVEELAGRLPEQQRYTDPDLQIPQDPFEIDETAFARVETAIAALQGRSEAERRRWFGEFITRYRASGDVQASPDHTPWKQALVAIAGGQSLYRHPFARFAWSRDGKQALLHVSGESHALSPADAALLCRNNTLDASNLNQLTKTGQAALAALYEQGVFQLAEAE
jgi:50S ribosomal protein L16 3-hydroxylase